MHRLVILVGLVGLATAAAGQVQAERLEALAARVGPRLILFSDVRLARDLGFVSQGEPLDATLEALIDRTLMLMEVERFQPPEPPDTRVTESLAATRARAGDAKWQTVLRQNGVGEEYARTRIRDDLRLSAYLQQRFGTLATPSEEELKRMYDERQPTPGAGPAPTLEALRAEQTAARFERLVKDWVTQLRSRGDVSVRLTRDPR